MSENVQEAALEILKSIQESIVRLEAKIDGIDTRLPEIGDGLCAKIDALSAKFDQLSGMLVRFQRDMAGNQVMRSRV